MTCLIPAILSGPLETAARRKRGGMSGEKARPRSEEPAALAWAGEPRRGTSVERMESRGAESVRTRINHDYDSVLFQLETI